MSKKCIPMLQDSTWVTDPYINLDSMMALTYVSDKSQSNEYDGVMSMAYIFQQNVNDIKGAMGTLETELKDYLKRRYESVKVFVEEVHSEEKVDGFYQDISISGEVVDEGKVIPLNYGVNLKNSLLEDVFKKVNAI